MIWQERLGWSPQATEMHEREGPTVYRDADLLPPTVPPWVPERLRGHDLSPLQAKFAAEVMFLSGVFSIRQADAWLAHASPEHAERSDPRERRSYCIEFLRPLFAPRRGGNAVADLVDLRGAGDQVGRIRSRRWYELVELFGSPYCRPATPDVLIERLLVLDFIIDHQDGAWYGQKCQQIISLNHLGVELGTLPWRGGLKGLDEEWSPDWGRTAFPDHLPFEKEYGWVVVFVFPACAVRTSHGVRQRFDRYFPLWCALRERGLQVKVVVAHPRGRVPTDLPQLAAGPDEVDSNRARWGALKLVFELALVWRNEEIVHAQGGRETLKTKVKDLDRRLAELPRVQGTGVMVMEVWESPRIAAHTD